MEILGGMAHGGRHGGREPGQQRLPGGLIETRDEHCGFTEIAFLGHAVNRYRSAGKGVQRGLSGGIADPGLQDAGSRIGIFTNHVG